jgi:SAM-dependent methyltransferase
MDHADHVFLLRGGVDTVGGVWADLGSGGGAFTLALADLLGPGGVIYSVDQDAYALRQQQEAMTRRFPGVTVHYLTGDFTRPLALPPLDGIVMANALHFVARPQQEDVVRRLRSYLKPGGRMIVVEYDADAGNRWVPYPLSVASWEDLAQRAGFGVTHHLASVPSGFLLAIYAAVSW